MVFWPMTDMEKLKAAWAISTDSVESGPKKTPVIGITGTGGSGKSSVVDELLYRFLQQQPEIRIAVYWPWTQPAVARVAPCWGIELG